MAWADNLFGSRIGFSSLLLRSLAQSLMNSNSGHQFVITFPNQSVASTQNTVAVIIGGNYCSKKLSYSVIA